MQRFYNAILNLTASKKNKKTMLISGMLIKPTWYDATDNAGVSKETFKEEMFWKCFYHVFCLTAKLEDIN